MACAEPLLLTPLGARPNPIRSGPAVFVTHHRTFLGLSWWRRFSLIATTLSASLSVPCFQANGADVLPRMLLLDGSHQGPTLIVAVGERGTILRSKNRGQTWQAALVPQRAPLTAISVPPEVASTHAWAVGHDALILHSADAGLTWAVLFQGADRQSSFLDVLALDEHQIIAVGADALYAESHDGGLTWTKRKIGDADRHFNRLTRGPTGTLYIAGEQGVLLRSADAGVRWSPLTVPSAGSFYGILPLGQHTLLAYGLRGRLYRSTDDGGTWQTIATPKPSLLATATQLKSRVIVIAGSAGTLLTSHDEGKTFASWATSPTRGIAKLVEMPDGSLLALGEAGATLLPKP